MKKAPTIMISACLLGIKCRYDGGHSRSDDVLGFIDSILFVPFCPEQLGGLTTPRSPAKIEGGDGRDVLRKRARVVNANGEDITDQFIRGAEEAFKLAGITGSTIAVTKDKSPSCGLTTPYCDTPGGNGRGVTSALFESHGIRIIEPGGNGRFPSAAFLELIRETL